MDARRQRFTQCSGSFVAQSQGSRQGWCSRTQGSVEGHDRGPEWERSLVYELRETATGGSTTLWISPCSLAPPMPTHSVTAKLLGLPVVTCGMVKIPETKL